MSSFEPVFNASLDVLKQMQRYRKLFITGCAKSGTTWLGLSLNGHRQIVVDGEGRFAWRFFPLLEQAMKLFNQDQQNVSGSALGKFSNEDFATLMRVSTDRVLHRYLMASGKSPETVRVIGDKTPQHILSTEILRALYSGCRFINIIRDPRDAATSALFHFGKDDPTPRGQYIENFIRNSWGSSVQIAVDVERQLGNESFLNVRYEDLHKDPVPVLRKCLLFLGVDASEAAIEVCREAGSFEKLSGGRKRGQTDSNSFYRNGQIGDWKNHIDPELANRCCAPVAELMKQFDYALEPGPIAVSLFVNQPGLTSAA
jgi:hypothetical protein